MSTWRDSNPGRTVSQSHRAAAAAAAQVCLPWLTWVSTGGSYQWAPHCNNGGNLSDCPRTEIALPGCARTACSLEEFAQVVQDRISRTGGWQDLCLTASSDRSGDAVC